MRLLCLPRCSISRHSLLSACALWHADVQPPLLGCVVCCFTAASHLLSSHVAPRNACRRATPHCIVVLLCQQLCSGHCCPSLGSQPCQCCRLWPPADWSLHCLPIAGAGLSPVDTLQPSSVIAEFLCPSPCYLMDLSCLTAQTVLGIFSRQADEASNIGDCHCLQGCCGL